MRFEPAPEYEVFPTPGRPLKPYVAAVRAARETQPLIRDFDPDAVVADVLTVAAAMSAELEGRTWATLVPHVFQVSEPGFPPYSVGARLPRTRVGGAFWRAIDPVLRGGIRQGREELNGARERVGLPPLDRDHGGVSRELTIVGTLPQLEYPRLSTEPWARVVGPLMWERPFEEVEPPPGDEPLVLVAPSTSQDPEQRLFLDALEGLAGLPVRVLATTNRRQPQRAFSVPANARVVDWLSYAKTMPLCDAVVCHAGHGTVVRALASGVPVVACPAAGDMAENAARVAWAGAGVSLPRRLVTPRGVRLAVARVLGDSRYRERAGELAAWAAEHDAGEVAAGALEQLVERGSGGS